MALKRPYDTAGHQASTTIESGPSGERIPPLKLRIKDVQVSSVQKVITGICSANKKDDKLSAILKIDDVVVSELNKDDAKELMGVLRDLLQKEQAANIKAKILNILDELIKIPHLNQLSSVDEFIDLAQREGENAITAKRSFQGSKNQDRGQVLHKI